MTHVERRLQTLEAALAVGAQPDLAECLHEALERHRQGERLPKRTLEGPIGARLAQALRRARQARKRHRSEKGDDPMTGKL
jgi:hypothetical protein